MSAPTREVVDVGRRKGLIIFGLITAMLLAALDQTVFGTALPTIVGELHGVEHMLWVTTAYILASTIAMPVYGKFGDAFGHKRMFALAIVLFIAGSVIGGLASNMTWLIIGRAVQGAGGGGLMIQVMAVIAHIIPPADRGKYTGIIGLAFVVPSVVGPLLGGLFTDPHTILGLETSWRWVFWMNLPMGVIALLCVWCFVPRLPRPDRKPVIDIVGIALLAIASTSIVLTTSWGGTTYEWGSDTITTLIVVAIISSVLFIAVESKAAAEPVIPGSLFHNRNFALVTVAGVVLGIAMFGTLVYTPTYLQMVTGYDATESGYLMIPMMIGMLITTTIVGRVISRTKRYKWAPIAGMIFIGVALLLLSTISPSLSIWVVCSYLTLLGVGLGMSMQTLMLIVQNEFPVAQVGTAVSSNTYFRQMGASLGAALVGALFTANLTNLLAERFPSMPVSGSESVNSLTPAIVRTLPPNVRDVIIGAYNDALTPVFLWMVPLLIVATIILLFIKEKPLADTIEPISITDPAEVDGPSFVALKVDDATQTRPKKHRR